MGDIHWTAELLEPTGLSPASTAELDFRYVNENEYPHHIRSISIAPTWDLTDESTYSVDCEVPPGEEDILPWIPVETPSGIGGRQGVRLGVEVRGDPEAADMDYQQLWDNDLFRLPVRNAERYEALVCISGDEDHCPVIRQLLENWGFNIHRVDTQQEAIDRFRATDTPPRCFVGVLFPDGDLADQQVLNSVATTSLSHLATRIIFKHDRATTPNLPDIIKPIECDLTDPIRLETAAGPKLRRVRMTEETDLRNAFHNRAEDSPLSDVAEEDGTTVRQTIEKKIQDSLEEIRDSIQNSPERAQELVEEFPKQLAWAVAMYTILSATGIDEDIDELIAEIKRELDPPTPKVGEETGGPTTQTEAAFEYPSGYDETGIVDSSAATQAHTEGILGYESFRTSYRATVETPNQTVQVDITKSVETAERRALRETKIGPREQAEYYDNGTVYVRTDLPGSNTSYKTRQQPLNLRSVSGKRFVDPVIANVTYGEATRVDRGGEQLVQYKSRSLASTSGLFGENVSMADVSEFSATILVGADGVVPHTEYGATVDRPGGERKLTVSIDVAEINSTTVRRPNWVDQAASSSSS